MNKTKITAHAGCLNTKIDSLESVVKGIDLGVDYCEVDVNCLKNGIGVLKHDEIRDENEALVKLEEVFILIKNENISLNLDMKNKGALTYIEEKAVEHSVVEKLILSGVDENDTLNLKNSDYKINYLMNVEYEGVLDTKELIDKYISYAINTGALGLNIDHKYCTKEVIDEAHKKNLMISVWTVDDTDDIEKFIKLGVDNLTTNRPDLAKKALNSNN